MKSSSAEETKKLASDFIKTLVPKKDIATVVALFGDLGAGKTTFVQGAGEALGVTEVMHSPTFVIMKGYRVQGSPSSKAKLTTGQAGFRKLIHIDCYRLKSADELRVLGFQELLTDPANLMLIEWPERIAPLLPEYVIKIKFEHGAENERDITILNL